MVEAIATTYTIDYPESDGKPVGETDVHRRELLYTAETLERYFAARNDVYVSGNLLFYYEEGNPAAVVSPDVFVVFGPAPGLRRTYKLWQEKYAPSFVLEVSSRDTRFEDRGTKRALYAELGVQEYLLFDPEGEYLKPPLQGYTLVGGEYQPMSRMADGAIYSRTLDLTLRKQGLELHLYRVAGDRILRTNELEAAYLAGVARAEYETQRAEHETQRAEHEAQRAEYEAQRAESEAQRAESEAQRAESEAQRAESEAQRASTAEEEVARLRAEIERLRGGV